MRRLLVLLFSFFALPVMAANQDGDGRYLGSGAWVVEVTAPMVLSATDVIANVSAGWVYDVSPANIPNYVTDIIRVTAKQVETCGVRILGIACILDATSSEVVIWDDELFPDNTRLLSNKMDNIAYPSIPAFWVKGVTGYQWIEFIRPVWLDSGFILAVTQAKATVHYVRDSWR